MACRRRPSRWIPARSPPVSRSPARAIICFAWPALEREARAYGLVRLPFTIWEFTAGVCYRRSAAELPFVSLLVEALRRLTAEAV